MAYPQYPMVVHGKKPHLALGPAALDRVCAHTCMHYGACSHCIPNGAQHSPHCANQEWPLQQCSTTINGVQLAQRWSTPSPLYSTLLSTIRA
jgi:hypothetical protein